MSSTNCPNCASSRYPNNEGHCPDCDYPPLWRLTLTGDSGSMSFGVRTRMGSALLLRLSPDAQYTERDDQFSVFCRDSDWLILSCPCTRNPTLLNGVKLTAECCLKDGDEISLGSRTDPTRQVMQLRVGMVAS